MENINVIDLQQLCTQPKDIFIIDVRTAAEYQSGHIPNAFNMPLGDTTPEMILQNANGKDIAVVCQSGGRSAKCCSALLAHGAPNIKLYNVQGGTQAWRAAGLPISGGDRKVLSLERQVRIAAGILVLLGVLLGGTVHAGFIFLSAFVGAGLIFAGITDWCGMAMLLAKMPWNRNG
jgi:rhodanese-related sulfurtransferase